MGIGLLRSGLAGTAGGAVPTNPDAVRVNVGYAGRSALERVRAAGEVARGFSNDEARERLTGTAEDFGLDRNESGAGLLDVAAALGEDSSDNR